MSTSTVLQLEEYRGRRQQRLDTTLALYSSDAHRAELLRHLWRGMSLTGSDRGAILWLDEYGPGLVHPHVVLDVAADQPRRTFALDLLRRTWEQGVPGVLDIPDSQQDGILRLGDSTRSSFSVALGSDGVRSWFLVLDSLAPRGPLDDAVGEELLFLAGESAAVLLHKDMDGAAEGDRGRRSFSAWPVLQDVEGREDDSVLGRRISCRFLVTRSVRLLLDDDLAADHDDMAHRIAGIRQEISGVAPCAESHLWGRVLDALEAGPSRELAAAVLALGVEVESQGHWSGAAELHRTTHELAAAVGATEVGVDASHYLGRVYRRQGDWQEAIRWYGAARRAAAALADRAREARTLDGTAAIFIGQGNLPEARRVLHEALQVVDDTDDPDARGGIHHSLMTVAHTAGQLDEAARQGWRSFHAHRSTRRRLQALTGLGGVLLEARALGAAGTAFSIVAEQVDDHVYRLYALHGLSMVAAFSGDRRNFERRISSLDGSGFREGPPDFIAEALLERGDGYLALGDEERARRLYHDAVAFSEDHGVNEFLVRAEESLGRLDRAAVESPRQVPSEAPQFLPEEELGRIQAELGAIRQAALVESL